MSIKDHKFFFIIALSVCITVPLTNDIFISGMPEMEHFFAGSNISLVLSIFLLGLAIAQPFYGPLSDRFGRKPVLLIGLLIYTLASALAMLADSFSVLLIGRLMQAIGICSAITSALAIARDTCKDEELIKSTSLIMSLMAIGPVTAPLIGSFLNDSWGWRASFYFLFILGCFYTLWIGFFLKETHVNKNMQALAFMQIFKNYFSFVKNTNFLLFCIVSGFSYGVLFSYIGLSPLFIIQQMQYSLIDFGMIIAINALAIIFMAIVIPKLTSRFSFERITQLGLMLILCGGLIMWLLNLYSPENIYTFMFPMFIATLGMGTIRPTASAGAMRLIESKVAGVAASFFNIFSFASGTIAISVTTQFIHDVSGFGLFMMCMGISAFLILNVFFPAMRIKRAKVLQFNAKDHN